MDTIKYPHICTAEEVLSHFKVSPLRGLSDEEVQKQREKFGLNALEHEEGKSIFKLILAQFEDLLVRILLLAAFVSLGLAVFSGDFESEGFTAFIEPIVILTILILNAAVGVFQETNAEKALEALKSLQPELARCLRNGRWQTINTEELVPGDIVDVRVGDKMPADLRLIQLRTSSIRVEQSQLTGESCSVNKNEDAMSEEFRHVEIQAKTNMLFSSTTVVNGHGIACVCATGMNTEIGLIQSAVKLAGDDEEQTPLQQKLDEFGELLSKVIFAICLVVWLINWKNFYDPIHGGVLRGCIYYFKIAVALAVAAIPEGLPAVITTCLALGTKKMAHKNAIVRRLQSVETLGCTTVICSDKTGTLTTNEMTCTKFVVLKNDNSLSRYEVEGCSYTPIGIIKNVDTFQEFKGIEENEVCLQMFARCGSLCNESRIMIQNGKYNRQGEPTEAAIRVLVEKLGCPVKKLNDKFFQNTNRGEDATVFSAYWNENYKHLATLEFTRDRKSMSILYRNEIEKENQLFIKGAPESILERCETVMLPDGSIQRMSADIKNKIMNEVNSMALESLRTLCLAVKLNTGILRDYDGHKHKAYHLLVDPANFIELENQMTFLGVVGLLDPPRPEVGTAIKMCGNAGINVMMITGDNKLTAESIALKIGILDHSCDLKKKSFTGKEFENLTMEQKIKILSGGSAVFSRTEPRHKQAIVKILKQLGEITAMTGDGVNDAPALKQADIGIAMGITGTEVAKEAADMILADDNFNSIVLAVQEGRSIYNNMKAFIRYLISSNIGEVASIFLTAALGIPEGLAPVQLLWVNLVTDGPPATALGFNPPDVDVMKKAPRHRQDALISGWVFFRYLVIGIYVGVATVGIFIWWYLYGIDPTDGNTLISFFQLQNWHTCKSWENFNVNNVYNMTPNDPCTYFNAGKIKASTLSLTVLVVIEMLNALNALSEDGSLLQMPPWSNPWLIVAIFSSISVHCCILYTPFLAKIFGVVPLTLHDWIWVFLWSFPVIILDELLKFIARSYSKSQKKTKIVVHPLKKD